MLKTYKTAKGILNASVADIEAGHWCKGTLARIEETDLNAHDNLAGAYGGDEATLKNKHIGCALGLCVMHGGDGKEVKVLNDVTHIVVEVEQPGGHSSDHVQRAVRALFAAIPDKNKSKQRTLKVYRPDLVEGGEIPVDAMCDVIANYNDQENMRKGKAAEWFKRALKVVTN